jgi:hypothetical protein
MRKIEAIDYMRAIAIVAIIIIHVIAWHDSSITTDYTKVQSLFNLRNILQFSVVTIVICSGFSLYLNNININLNFQELKEFYKKRLKRILFPWWIFLYAFFIIHAVIQIIFNIELVDLSTEYIINSFLMIGGVGFGWLILLMILIAILFPFLKYLYDKSNKIILFASLITLYLLSIISYYNNPLDIFNTTANNIHILSSVFLVVSFILGWSIIYLIGFVLGSYYQEHAMKKEITLTFLFIIIFLVINFAYDSLNMNKTLYLNKYPPSPFYLSFGLMITFMLLSFFYIYKRPIHEYLRKIISFLSDNSYWLFMWNALTLSFIIPMLTLFKIDNIYLKLGIDILLNILAVSVLVVLQKKFIKIELQTEKHHF